MGSAEVEIVDAPPVRGQSVVLHTTMTDGYVAAVPAISNTVTIVNAAPVVTGVGLTPEAPRTDDTSTVTFTTSDLEGDPLTLAYAWTVDGVAAGTGDVLTGTSFSRDQLVVVEVTAFDGADGSAPTNASVTIGNTPPGAPVIDITPDQAEDGDDLVCVVTTPATDADGDALATTITWTVDGAPYAAATTTTLAGDTIPASETILGQTWVCTMDTTDGTDAGPSVDTTAVVGCDEDRDGYADTMCGGDDCDDADAAIHPGAEEVCAGATRTATACRATPIRPWWARSGTGMPTQTPTA